MALSEAPASKRIQITLPTVLIDRLETIAKNRGIGLSTLIRMLLHASLEQ